MTIYQKSREIAEKYPENEALGWLVGGAYQVMTYQQLSEKIDKLAAGFAQQGLVKGDKIAFMVPNSPEWAMIDLACARLGIINTSIHTTYGPEYITYIVEHATARWLIIDKKFWDRHKDKLCNLPVERIIVSGPDGDFQDLFVDGKPPEASVAENDIHTIIYTSGTTGKPKGVMLTHKNIIFDAFGAKEYVPVGSRDRFLSFLPLSHALERTAGHYVPIFSGSSIYYAQNSKTMKDDIKLARPTILISVPRVFEKAYDAIWDKVRAGSKLKQWLFFKALDYGTKCRKGELKFTEKILYKILDALVLKKIRASLGGNLRFAISGGSSLSVDIMQFFQDIGILIVEGYGLTETSPIISVNKPDRCKLGTVGLTLKCVEVRVNDDREILARGDIVMKGYFKNEEATREVVDSEGWFSTGDLGEIDSNGFLTITGRKKEMIVLSTGKNVAPVPIEQELDANRFIAQSCVYGDGQKNISALIVPDFEELKKWVREKNIVYKLPDTLKRDDVRNLYEKQIHSQLNHFPENEQVRDFRLISEEFTQENDLLTPTLKLKRKNILDRYQN